MSIHFEKVKNFYERGFWPIKRVKNAVIKGWITEEEYELIINKEKDNKI